MISYAQNYEDVMLRRALEHVEQGCYVDVGAWDPIEHSVTYGFYLSGWRGINIEPNPAYFERLAAARPDDRNLPIAVGTPAGRRRFHAIEGTGLSTLDPDYAAEAEARGFLAETIDVEVRPLTDIVREAGLRVIHFLKIDAEGKDAEVLESLDLQQHRPWIILVESDKLSDGVGDRLAGNGYSLVYSDGINSFYLAREHDELSTRFRYPPNVSDEIVTHAEAKLREEITVNWARYESMIAQHNDLWTRYSALVTERDRLVDLLTQAETREAAYAAEAVLARSRPIWNAWQALRARIQRRSGVAGARRTASE